MSIAPRNACSPRPAGILPQVLPNMLLATLYMWVSNTRSATILGVVGAGGIGYQLADRLRVYEFGQASLIIILIVAADR
jgi:phosphonate transport system permease protein